MRHSIGLTLVLFIVLFLAFGGASCGGFGGSSSLTSTVPTWIWASWSGGAAGPPNDRRDEEATEWIGQMCPASSILLENYGDRYTSGLHVQNNCTITVTLYLCTTKGDQQAEFEECATDPFYTPWNDLYIIPLNPGEFGVDISTTPDLSINVFFCSDEMQLGLDTPLRCIGL